jgi:hypothetical protein
MTEKYSDADLGSIQAKKFRTNMTAKHSDYERKIERLLKHTRQEMKHLANLGLYLKLVKYIKVRDKNGKIITIPNQGYDPQVAKAFYKGLSKEERRKKFEDLRQKKIKAEKYFEKNRDFSIALRLADDKESEREKEVKAIEEATGESMENVLTPEETIAYENQLREQLKKRKKEQEQSFLSQLTGVS